MKKIYTLAILLAGIILSAGITSCEFDTSPEPPDYPIYVTYIITAQNLTYEGPETVLTEIDQWIKNNRVAYDIRMNYSTGDPSEFTKQDAEAIKKYEEFLPKFKNYLEKELKPKFGTGDYLDVKQIKATYSVTAKRMQGQQGDLKYDQVEFSFP